MSRTDSVDRSVYERFISWSRGSRVQTFIASLLILGSLVYQVWQDPRQFEFVKLIAYVFIAVAIIEEYFKLKNKGVDLEKDKLDLTRTVNKIEKGLQASFIKNKHAFHYEIMTIVLDKIQDYLGNDALDPAVVKNYHDIIASVLSKSRKYAGMIQNKYQDFLEEMLDDKEQQDVPITEFKKMMIIDNLKAPVESEYKENIEENTNSITDFNKDLTGSSQKTVE